MTSSESRAHSPHLALLAGLERFDLLFHLREDIPETWVGVLALGVHLMEAPVHRGRV